MGKAGRFASFILLGRDSLRTWPPSEGDDFGEIGPWENEGERPPKQGWESERAEGNQCESGGRCFADPEQPKA
jgi:hypothetical protein